MIKRVWMAALVCSTFGLALLNMNCNTTARILFEENELTGIVVTNAVTTQSGGLAQCNPTQGNSSKAILSTVIFGSVKQDNTTKVIAIVPGDTVSRAVVQTTGNNANLTQAHLSFTNVCIQPDGNGMCSDTEIAAQGAGIIANQVIFHKRMERSEALGLVILLDQSGSISGSVEAKGTGFIEVQDKITDGNLASDKDAVRITAVQNLIENLNPKDKVLVVAFNSKDGLFTVCPKDVKQQITDFEQQAAACYSANKKPLTDPQLSIDTLQSTEIIFQAKGRTPLWQAVDWALGFHQKNSAGLKPQILVVTDGADTCTKSYEGFEDCPGAVTFDTVKSKVDGLQTPVPVHFVQFKSKVQTIRDPQQQELACRSGGEYIFLDNVKGLRDSGNTKGALTLMRFLFLGTWQISTTASQIQGADGYYKLQGVLNLNSPTLGNPLQFPMQVDPENRDSRMHVYKNGSVQ